MNPVFGAIAIIIIVAIVSFTILSLVKTIIHGRAAQWGKDDAKVPPLFEKMFEKAAAERDEKIRKLEARVIVLEKIVTDNHDARRLADEIEGLRG